MNISPMQYEPDVEGQRDGFPLRAEPRVDSSIVSSGLAPSPVLTVRPREPLVQFAWLVILAQIHQI